MIKVHVASVTFGGGTRDYCYKTDLPLIMGQDVVVFSSNGLGMAKVWNPNVTAPEQKEKATAWIYQVVDVEACRRRIRAAEDEERFNLRN